MTTCSPSAWPAARSRAARLRSARGWIGLPAPPSLRRDAAAIERGRDLFGRRGRAARPATTASCSRTTPSSTSARAATFKVPSLLGVGARAPFMHDGCAATLEDRFGACGGGDRHGNTSQLSAARSPTRRVPGLAVALLHTDATSAGKRPLMNMTIEDQLARLSAEAYAYRARAVRLDARLRRLDHRAPTSPAARALHESAANVDHAVTSLCAAVSKVA